MLEKIGKDPYKAISTPSRDALLAVDELIKVNGLNLTIAEIGVGVGATTVEFARKLCSQGRLILFDYQESVQSLSADLAGLGFTNVESFGNSRLVYDSYCWNLAKLALASRERGEAAFIDFAYLDGAHSFVHDAPAALVLKEIIKPGGLLLFDDLNWTYDTSPTMNPRVNPQVAGWYTLDQLSVPHVQMICKLFVDSDDRFVRETFGGRVSSGRALYRRVKV